MKYRGPHVPSVLWRMRLLVLLCLSLSDTTTTLAQEQQTCPAPKPTTQKQEYVIGSNTFHIPIWDYLTERIGSEFEPNISFTRQTANTYLKVPLDEINANANGAYDDLLQYDFVLTNAYSAACFATEQQTVPLATQLHVTDPRYNLTHYGSVLYTLRNRTDIVSIQDVKGKKVGTNKLSNLATHLCYDVLLRNGIHNLQDPQQTIFFKTSNDALAALLEGKVDVGCAASAILENYHDPVTGEPLDLSQIRVLNPVNDIGDDVVNNYPHVLSSQLVPAWLFQAYPHVETNVMMRVQQELLAFRDHADVAPALLACLQAQGCALDDDQCKQNCFATLLSSGTVRNCDTTPDIALAAWQAMNASGLTGGFVEPLQNLKVRDIQETTGFLRKSPNEDPQCVRMNNIVDATTCPPNHFARSSQEIQQQCNVSGLECYDRDCICNPCVKAFEVDFFTVPEAEEEHHRMEDDGSYSDHSLVGSGCSKFSICGSVEQEHVLSFHTIDNKGREGAAMTGAFLLEDETERDFNFTYKGNGTYYYDWHATSTTTGQKTIKIRIDNEEIPESPFRIVVEKRDCVSDTGG